MLNLNQIANQTTRNVDTFRAVSPVFGELENGLWDLSLSIHSEPELAWQEHRSVVKLTDFLGRYGFTIVRNYCNLETSFLARFELDGDGPTVTYMAEYDALPEIGHACGHNLICAASVGAAIALAQAARANNLGGRIEVVGTPAEEGGGGKIALLERGAFADSDVAMMFHPGARTMPIRGALAACRFTMTFHGKAAHAASNPHLGVNALDACRLMFNAIDAMREHFRDETRVHGIVREGGSAVNIVPERVVAQVMVRHKDLEYLNEVKQQVVRCAQGAAMAVGATVEIDEGVTYAQRNNNATLALRLGGYLQELGEPVLDPPVVGGVGSSDFGNVSQLVPAIHPYIAIVKEGISNHTQEFADAAGSPTGRRGMLLAAKSLAMTGFDVLSDSEFMQAARTEFSPGEIA